MGEITFSKKQFLYRDGQHDQTLIDARKLIENNSRIPMVFGNDHRLSLIKITNILRGQHDALFAENLPAKQECMLIDFLIARRLLKSAMPLNIVEIGATKGILSFHLATMIGQYNVESSLFCVCNAVGSTDNSQWTEKISKVDTLPKLSMITADYGQTGLQSHGFDVVVLNGSEFFIDAGKVVKEAERLVRSKGIIICLEKERSQLSDEFSKRFSEHETFEVDSDTAVFYAVCQKQTQEDMDKSTDVREIEDFLAEVRKALQEEQSKQQLSGYYKELERYIDNAIDNSLFDLKAELIGCQDEVLNAMYPVEFNEEVHMDKQKVILSIGLLVSNRKETIQKCLESLTPIREQIPCELIIIDTGCDADLRQILTGYADILKAFTWCNDFSKARNESMKYSSGEWFLYLDDDEWFVEPEELIAFFKSGEYHKYGCASYIQRNFLDMKASQYTDTWVARMIRRDDDTHFESKIHEYLTPVRGKKKHLHSKVYHFGYVYPDEATKLKHFERNRVLLEEMIKEEPDKLRWRLQLLQEYRSIDDYPHMYELGEQGLEQTKDCDSYADNIYLGAFYAAKVLAKMGQEEYVVAKQLCLQAETDTRNTEFCRAFLYQSLARICFFLGEYVLSEENALKYLEQKEWFSGHKEEQYEQQIAPFVGECFDEVKQKEIYSLLICDGLKRKDTIYLKQYLDYLKWNEKHVYVFEKIAETLIEAMCTMPREAIFEETIRLMHGHVPLWKYFVSEIQRLETEGYEGIRNIVNFIQSVLPELQGEPEQQNAQGQQIAPEQAQLLELAERIKEQLRMLIANGMNKEATAIIGQLRSMLPEDEELIKLEEELRKQENE